MKCQQKVERDAFNERVEEPCAKPVTDYRQCGRGCKEERGYCPEHGAIERATEEMEAHHKTHDVFRDDGPIMRTGGDDDEKWRVAELAPRDTAFVVGFIDTITGTFAGVGVFSEETPTTKVTMFPFTILRGRGRDYQEGLDNLRARFADPVVPWAWLVRLLDERSREQIGLVTA